MTYHSQVAAAAFPAPLASSGLAYLRQRAHWISFSIPKTIYRFLCRRGNLKWLNARKPSCGCHLILPQNRIFAAFLTSIFGAHTFTPSWVRSQNPRFATAAASCVCDCVWAGTEAQCRHLVSDTCSKRSVSSLDHPQRHCQTHTHTHTYTHVISSPPCSDLFAVMTSLSASLDVTQRVSRWAACSQLQWRLSKHWHRSIDLSVSGVYSLILTVSRRQDIVPAV